MSSETDSKPHEQPQVTSTTSYEPSGAGSTTANTPNSQDSASSHESGTPTPEYNGTDIDPAALKVGSGEGVTVNGVNDVVDLKREMEDTILGLPEGEETLQLIKEEEEPLLVTSNQEIELLEQGPESVGEDIQDWTQDESKRVKVYELIGTRWIDQGTAFCGCQFLEDSHDAYIVARSERNYDEIILSTVIRGSDVYQRQQETLIVWTEPDGVDYALSFQDPEGCAEIWSFINDVQSHINNRDEQSTVGSSPQIGPESSSSVTAASILRSGHLPRPALGIIGDIERAIKTLARTQTVKERMCEYIQQESYIKGLIEVMNTAEDLESIENLHSLCSLMQTILTLNDHSMYEHILEDDMFFGVVGMLEYDPDFPSHKANYRQFLHQTSQFHQPITIQDPSIQKKIHHTYRLQFLKDVVLARVLDDSTFNVLNSCIIFNQIDIINHVQQDHTFLREIVSLFVDEEMLSGGNPNNHAKKAGQAPQLAASSSGEGEDTDAMQVDPKVTSSPKPNGAAPLANGHSEPSTSKRKPGAYAFGPPENMTEEDITLRKEVILLIQQLCVMGKNVQLAARIQLFRCLVDRGILFAVQWALGLPERESDNKALISAAGEILITLLDHDLNGVRGHVLKQVVAIEKERATGKRGSREAETMLEMVCRLMASSRDLAVQSHIGDALKIWMDVPQVDGPTPGGEAMGPSKPALRKDDPGTERFMEYFYKDCIKSLFKPFFDIPEWKSVEGSVLPLTAEETNRYVYLCDLFYNFLAQHHHRSLFYFMSSRVSLRIPSLFKARDKHLRHASFRIFRLLLKQNNKNTHEIVKQNGILKPILDLTLRESRRDNLLSCSCQEYFDSMRRDNIKSLASVCMTEHEEEIRTLAKSTLGGTRFEQFVAWWSWEMIQQNREPIVEAAKPDMAVETRKWPSGRGMDAEEEDYFNGDDDDDDFVIVNAPTSPLLPTTGGITGSLPSFGSLKRKRRSSVGSGARPPLRAPVLNTLLDYGDEEDKDDRPPLAIAKRTSPEITPSAPSLFSRLTPKPSSPPMRALKPEEDEDMMDAIARSSSRPESPGPGLMASLENLRPGDKRRRDDDDDDELLARVSKSKRPDTGAQKDQPAGQAKKNGEDSSKKIKVNIRKTSLGSVSSPQASPSDPGAKDGDTG